ncbi:hypothetical protein CCR75_008593 [Bremia lactucae]|uniref:Fungal lipase-like domain-containing protein n=1 Tax=Bremia lactucae TaxID=4779 RepID=A0A976FRV1_BRELC|nr:hypothetical protein CCR75_008593 [Bremia lactucae]
MRLLRPLVLIVQSLVVSSASPVWQHSFPLDQAPSPIIVSSLSSDGAGFLYNETTALYLAHVTSISYCQSRHIIEWNCQPCAFVRPLVGVTVFEDTKDNFQGLVGYSELYDAIVIAFRGSMDVTNWLDNLTFIKTRAYVHFPSVMVHEGFYWAYRSVALQVTKALHKLQKEHPFASLMVTGHSLGGAVATICAFELEYIEKISVKALYTFGNPRVGNIHFSLKMKNTSMDSVRVTHFRDIVPHLPPTWTGFKHTVEEIFYDQFSATYRNCSATNGEDPTCSNSCSPFSCTSIALGLNLQTSVVQDNVPIEVAAGLFVGSIHASFNLEALKASRISHVLNLAGSTVAFPNDFTYLSLSIRDKEYANLLSCLPIAAVFINAGLNDGGVLIHCSGGRSRSPAVAMAFLMMKQQLSYSFILAHLKSLRPIISLNAGFDAQLKCLETACGNVFVANQHVLKARLAHLSHQFENGELKSVVVKTRHLSRPTDNVASSVLISKNGRLLSGCDKRGMIGERVPSGFYLSMRPGSDPINDRAKKTSSLSFIPALRSMGTIFGCQCCGEALFCAGAIISPHNIAKLMYQADTCQDNLRFLEALQGQQGNTRNVLIAEKHHGAGKGTTKPFLSKLRLKPHSPSLTEKENVRACSYPISTTQQDAPLTEPDSSHFDNQFELKSLQQASDKGNSSNLLTLSPTELREELEKKSGGALWRSFSSFKSPKRTCYAAIESKKFNTQLNCTQLSKPSILTASDRQSYTEMESSAYAVFLKQNAIEWNRNMRQLLDVSNMKTSSKRSQSTFDQLKALLDEDLTVWLSLNDCHEWHVEPQVWAIGQASGHSEGDIQCPREACRAIVGEWRWNGSSNDCGDSVAPAFVMKKSAVCVLGNMISNPL